MDADDASVNRASERENGEAGIMLVAINHFWKIGRYRFGICRTISDIAVAYADPVCGLDQDPDVVCISRNNLRTAGHQLDQSSPPAMNIAWMA
jgi:hypothetical protein